MKRFALLWGGVAGAVALPLSMWACLWVWMRFAPSPALALISPVFGHALIRDGVLIGAVLGALSASLLVGQRSLWTRTLSVGAGVSVAAFFSEWIWHSFKDEPSAQAFF